MIHKKKSKTGSKSEKHFVIFRLFYLISFRQSSQDSWDFLYDPSERVSTTGHELKWLGTSALAQWFPTFLAYYPLSERVVPFSDFSFEYFYKPEEMKLQRFERIWGKREFSSSSSHKTTDGNHCSCGIRQKTLFSVIIISLVSDISGQCSLNISYWL